MFRSSFLVFAFIMCGTHLLSKVFRLQGFPHFGFGSAFQATSKLLAGRSFSALLRLSIRTSVPPKPSASRTATTLSQGYYYFITIYFISS